MTATICPARAPMTNGTGSLARRYDIDHLRVLVMLGVFFFHVMRFFDPLPWHLKDAQRSVVALSFIGFLNSFQMPMLMLVSGAGSWFALRSRTAGRYIGDRILRLLVPLYTVGFLLLIPPQYYWECVTNRGYSGSFRQFLPEYLGTLSFRPDLSFLSYWSGHLWFLRELFIISLVTLPLLILLKSGVGKRILEVFARGCGKPGGILLPVIPLLAAYLGLNCLWPAGHPLNGAIRTVHYLVFFLIGYCAMSNEVFTDGFRRHTRFCGILAVASFIGLAAWVLHWGYKPWEIQLMDLRRAAFMVLETVNTWAWIAFFMGLAAKHLNFNSDLLKYSNEAVLPFYLLHQTIILAVGYFIIQWDLGILPKYLIIAACSFGLIMGTYELLIRRVRVMRFLFGMRC